MAITYVTTLRWCGLKFYNYEKPRDKPRHHLAVVWIEMQTESNNNPAIWVTTLRWCGLKFKDVEGKEYEYAVTTLRWCGLK